MSGMDIVPSFFPENEDDGLVPAEFNDTPEAKIRRMVGVPEPAPERLITPMNPQGRAPRDGMGFSENVAGQFRSGGFTGAVAEAAELEAVKSGGEQFARGGFSEQQFRNLPTSVRERIIAEANQPGNKEQKLQDAEDSFYAQVAYDNSKANLSVASVAGAIVGSIPTPENLGGLSGLLVRQFPALAGRPILTAGIDAAVTNLLADPVVQGARMMSGAQAEYDPTQTALAPIIGFTIGAGGRAIPELPSMVRERQAAALGVDPAKVAPSAPDAPVVTPRPSVADTAPPAAAVDAPRVEPGVDPVIAKAVDEAIGADAAPVAEPAPTSPRVRERGLPITPDRQLFVADSDATIKAHPDYPAAKAGDAEAATRFVKEQITPDVIDAARARFPEDTIYVPVLAEEKSGRNAIPLAMAKKLSNDLGGEVATDVLQMNRAFHTGAGPMERLIARTEFDGAVVPGRRYVLVDDVTVMNSTLADMGAHIEANGGKVDGVVTLTNASRTKAPSPSRAQIMEIQRRFGDAIPELFRIKPEALTGDEAAYILNFRDVDALRGRVAKAVGERQQRLDSKSAGPGQGAGSAEVEPRPGLKVMRGPDGRINGFDLEASGLELAPTDDGRLLFRKRGTQPVQQLPPNQVQSGRPVADQGTPVAQPQAKPVTRAQRVEDVSRNLVQSFEALGREKRVKPGAQGQFDTATGVIRVKSIADLDTVAHEVGHDFHLTKARQDVDGLVARHKMELQDLGTGDKKGNQEAFAELFRLYVTNRNFAEQKYPKAAADLDALLRSKFPKQAEALDAIRADLDAIHRAPSGELVTSDTIQTAPPKFGDRFRKLLQSDRDPSGRSVYSAFDALYTAVVDKTHPIYRAVEILADIFEKRVGKPLEILPVDDTYMAARTLPGSHLTAGVMLEHGVIPAGMGEPQGPSMAGALEKALGQKWGEQAFADFGGYLVARRMVAEYTRFFNGEIPNPPGKFSLADYQRAVADIEAANPQFREAAQDVYGFLNNHLKRAFDKGIFTKEYYESSLKHVDYVPFVRDMADFAEDSGKIGNSGRPSSLRFSLMKAFKGSQRSVQNPIESIFKRIHDIEYVIAKNDAVASLARLAETAGPGSGAIAEAIPSSQLKGQPVNVIEAMKVAGKASNIDPADLQALILQTEDVLGDSTWTTLFRQADINPGDEPIVFYWVNGERRALRLADGRFGREMFHALNAMPDIEKNWFVSTLQVAQQILRTGVTRAPDFLAINFIRDQFTAALTAGRKYIPFVGAAKGVVDVIRQSADAKAYAARGGLAAGAISDALDRSMFGRNVRALEKAGVVKNAMAGDYLGAGAALFRQGIKALELSEAGTRLGLYKSYFAQAKEMGFDDLNASTYAAFRATDYVDFRKAGASMGLLRRWVPFLNAAIQGTDRDIRALADLPVLELKRGRGEKLTVRELDRLKDARVALIRVTSMGAILGGGLALMNADEEEYQTAPKFTKDTNFLVKVNDTWLAIPKPFGTPSAIVNAFEYAADAAIRNDPSLVGPWMEAVGKAYTPPTTNPLVSLAYDLPANYNRFQDRPIVPYYLQGVKPSEQYTAGTAELSKFIGSATGWSPMKVEYAINNLGGSSALNLLRASDMLMAKDAPEKQVYDWPIARRFVKNLARGNQATTEFFNLVGDKNGSYEQAENAYRVKVRNGERTAAEQFLRNLPEDERAWTVLQSQGFEATEKRLHPMQNAKDRTAVISGVLSQLNFNNLIREADIDRQNTTISRRDAEPIVLDKTTRARMIEGLQELQMVTTRNAMVAIGAKGTRGLNMVDPQPILDRLKAISPEAFGEFEDRLKAKKVYDFDTTVQAWPETKARLLRDGENADLSDLVPAGAKTKRKRRN